MGFVNQVNPDNFVDQKVKVLKVCCQECVQVVGDIIIPAPANLTLDPDTGLLNAPVSLEIVGAPQIRTIKVLVGKVVIMGIVPVRLLVNDCVICQLLEIPFQSVVDCTCAEPDGTTNVQTHDLQVEGLITSPVRLFNAEEYTLSLNLIIKAIVRMCVIISREEVLKVKAASQFCPCP
ncbi:hypothetical protein V6C27_02455 [Peptococcaceae bacterium 1198_IL3148]